MTDPLAAPLAGPLAGPLADPLADPLARPLSRVRLSAFTVEAAIGVYAHERGRTQPLVVSIALDLAVTRFSADRLDQTVDYDRLAAHVRGLAAGHVDLVETFAERLAALCLAEPGATAVRILVDKPEAVAGAVAGVEIVRLKA